MFKQKLPGIQQRSKWKPALFLKEMEKKIVAMSVYPLL